MTGYAPNTGAPPPDKDYASLSSGLLARKGHALPAVDAQMHEGVDINFAMTARQKEHATRPAPSPDTNIVALKLRADAANDRGSAKMASRHRGSQRRRKPKTQAVVSAPITIDAKASDAIASQPAAWTAIAPPQKTPTTRLSDTRSETDDLGTAQTAKQPRRAVSSEKRKGPPMATIRFKLPARDFIRMRTASRNLEMSGAALIREALDCYLEANAIDEIDEEHYRCELEELRALMQRRQEGPAQ